MGFGGARPALPGIILAACLTVACTQGASPRSESSNTPSEPADNTSARLLSDSPFLVADLNTTDAPFSYSSASGFTEVGDTTLFVNSDDVHGAELWRTDGTAEGTRMVRDLFPGPSSQGFSELVVLGERLYFKSEEGNRGYSLWSSNGTGEGTVPLKTFVDGPRFPIALDDKLLFMARPSQSLSSWGLWKSDGTAAGTVPVKALLGLSVHYVGYVYPARLGGWILFANSDAEHGEELWRSDGTEAGTMLVKDLRPGKAHSHPTSFARLGDQLLFWARTDSDSFDLWRTDGTPEGTVRLKAIQKSEYNSTFPTTLVSTANAVYFSAWDAEHGQELWVSDGTPEGTHPVANIFPGRYGSEPTSLTPVGTSLFFTARDEEAGRELWKTDGTPAGTRRVKDLRPGIQDGMGYMGSLVASPEEGTVFFAAHDGLVGYRLWKSDGTQAGTQVVTEDLPAGDGEWSISGRANGRLYLRTSRNELWVSNGTRDGTHPLTRLSRKQPSASPRWPVNMNGTLFFSANDGVHGEELWKSDGTREGTVRVTDLASGTASAYPSRLTPLNGSLLFLNGTREGGGGSVTLWRSDGEAGGELDYLMTDLASPDISPPHLVKVGEQAFFTRRSGSNSSDHELWRTDGTEAGTRRVKLVTGVPLGWQPEKLTAVGNRLFFVADANIGLEQLWASDGTEQGTSVVASISSGGSIARFEALRAAGEHLYFWAVTHKGYELWKSNGTAAGTLPLMRLTYGDNGQAGNAAALGNSLFFIANSATGKGPELWRTDGKDPVLLKVLAEQPSVPSPTSLTVMKGALYFWAHDGVHGYELWKSDGTAEGTGMLEEIAPGPVGAVSTPGPLVSLGPDGPLLFAASDGVSGLEPWRTDGTAEGTVRVVDLAPGIDSSSPEGMTAAGPYVFFQADDLTTGNELWALRRSVTDTTPPLLLCPQAPLAVEAVGPQGAHVRYDPATATDDTSRPVVRSKPASESLFPLGTTPVSVTALDDTGNRSTCTFDITVRDTTPPTLRCPTAQLAEAISPEGARVDYPAAIATDIASVPGIHYSEKSGSVFSLGEHRVEATATDGAGLTTSCAFTVTVRDTKAPVLWCPESRTFEATSKDGAEVYFSSPSATDAASTPEVVVSHAPGRFPLGRTEVKATARDASGNSSQCAFAVTVQDTVAPSVMCPPDMKQRTYNKEGMILSYPPAWTHDSVSVPTVTYSSPSGSRFPPGDTVVKVSAKDAQGNVESCTFHVIVETIPGSPDTGGPPPPIKHPPQPQGCGCQSGEGSVPGLVGLVLLGALARRRRPQSRT